MNIGGGEAADQLVRMMLSGSEVAVRLSAIEGFQQGGFTAAGWPDKRRYLVAFQLQVDIF